MRDWYYSHFQSLLRSEIPSLPLPKHSLPLRQYVVQSPSPPWLVRTGPRGRHIVQRPLPRCRGGGGRGSRQAPKAWGACFFRKRRQNVHRTNQTGRRRVVALAISPRGEAGGTRGPRAFVGGHIAGLDVSVPKRSDKREPARGTRTSRRGAREMVYGRFLFHKKAVGCRSSSLQLRWPSSVFLPFRPHLQQCRTACPVRDGDLQNHRPQRVPSYGGQVSKRGRQIF
jgi:hypothetical protein